jgi:hypothetical protein
MIGLLCFVLAVLASPIKSKIRLEAENATLRHQLATAPDAAPFGSDASDYLAVTRVVGRIPMPRGSTDANTFVELIDLREAGTEAGEVVTSSANTT